MFLFFLFSAITVSIQQPNYRVIENQNVVEVCVVLSGPADETITITGIARESVPADARGKVIITLSEGFLLYSGASK